MARALALARRGLNACEPNPRVGCVLVDATGRVVGEGFHRRAGEAHAERAALADADARGLAGAVPGATAYVTLEPCSHHGRTPPCADALVAAGVGRVVAAIEDPAPEVSGRGLARLAAAGIAVQTGVLAAEAEEVARGFLSRIRRRRPFVTVKLATSLDGATAMASGESRWITGPAARADVHLRRAAAGAILTGVGTVCTDDPAFTVRDVRPAAPWRQPLRAVLDPVLRTPPAASLVRDGGATLLFHGDSAPPARAKALASVGVTLVGPMPADAAGRLDAGAVLEELARRGVNEVMVEAGARLNGTLLGAGLVDEIVWYQAPHVMGAETLGAWAVPALQRMTQRCALEVRDCRRVGQDLRLVARPLPRPGTTPGAPPVTSATPATPAAGAATAKEE